jgi:Fur family ferric uptake transcriptional regulator
MTRSLSNFRATLASRGYRLTEARRRIVEALVLAGGHVSADELVELLRETGTEVGRMTVYRTLELLTELGLVRPVYQGTGAAHFVLLLDGHHHHLVCTKCHAVEEVDTCVMKDLERWAVGSHGFAVQGHLLEVFGICRECQAELLTDKAG